MKKTVVFIVFMLFISSIFAQQGNKRIELTDVVGGTFRQETGVGELRSMPDGEHYTQMNRERNMVVRYAYRTGNPVDTLFNARTARDCTFETFDDYMISSTGFRMLILRGRESIYRRSFKTETFDYDVRRNMVKPLTETGKKVMIPTFSPDGRMCAYVIENNIWLKKFDFDTEIQVTKDGAPNQIIYGATDWVYEEEFSVTNLMSWSSDSEYLAYVRFDETQVPEYTMQIYGDGLYPEYYNFKYPKAGYPNSVISLHSYCIETRDTKLLNVPVDKDGYIPRIAFTFDPEQLAVMTLNRHHSIFNLYYVNPKSGVSRLILKDENKRYVDSDWINALQFAKNSFLYVSEKDGYAHIYQYTSTGVQQRRVTQGNWDVTNLIGLDEATNTVYYESAEESPLRRSVYKVDGKGIKTRLSTETGTNSATFSANYAYYINRFTNVNTPLNISLCETKTGKTLRTLQDNAALKTTLGGFAYKDKEFLKLQTASGYELNAWIVKPANFDASKKYPVMIFQYSGPNSQSVTDRFEVGWEQYLATNGIICVGVDGRGTGARGEEFRKCTYLKMGELEAKDLVEAAQALTQFAYIDGKRLGIWGWSFGGYSTLMSMSMGNGTFKAGIAVASVTDWRYYDTVYTERFMRTPQENANGYNTTSPIQLAKNLQGKLLLIHGTADDNVHFKQSLDYAEALVQAGKQFDMHIYRDRDHGISGGNTRLHLYTKMSFFLMDNL
ncbi:MAG: DPP IV N-terminal domain-containing protein [Tannerella sp.]|jgi:dipeptidyl-peptidase-4|nr:DPP IV N-terminal domain-containing protein [Tannerella sp.]